MKRAAIFDYDNTLIAGDSFFPFLTHAAGFVPAYAALTLALCSYAFRRALGKPLVSLRTFVKDDLLYRLLKGKKRDALKDACEKTRQWQSINLPVMQKLLEHSKRGDTIVIASGSLDLYIFDLLQDVPHDAVICTDIGVENGIITGEMIHGNCVRQRKAERVAAWLMQNGPFDETFAYGNYPHDLPMMELAKHRIIVS
ncbi:MAG: HAD family hydrolase [Alphaproteobacteria bacterium]|nr:HAD family hydrolase [Alphaproteobacteria bacterium]